MMPLMEDDEIYFLQVVVNMIKLDHDAKMPLQRNFANSVLHVMAALGRHYMEMRGNFERIGAMLELNESIQERKCPDPIIVDEAASVRYSKERYREDE